MKIAVVSAIYHATPPVGYGGIERVVHRLTEELVRRGHDVVLFGAKGSHCSGKTITVDHYDPRNLPSGIRKASDIVDESALEAAMESYLADHSVDVIHDFSFQNKYVLKHREIPSVISTCVPPPQGYQRPNLVACSDAHAKLCGGSTRYVHYGLDLERWPFNFQKDKHLVHISKITSYKGQHIAIDAARKARTPLQIAGNIEDPVYYYTKILPRLLMSRNVRYIGEIDGTVDALTRARALVQTPLWFDCFPLVILESLACGTPVIAFGEGGIPEQIVNGQTGFVCQNADELREAMERIDEIRPQDCRQYAEEHFSVKRFAEDYLNLYREVMDGVTW